MKLHPVELNKYLNAYVGNSLTSEEFQDFERFILNRWKDEEDFSSLDFSHESRLWNQERITV